MTPWSILAGACAELGQFDDAWCCLGEAMPAVETTKEGCGLESHAGLKPWLSSVACYYRLAALCAAFAAIAEGAKVLAVRAGLFWRPTLHAPIVTKQALAERY